MRLNGFDRDKQGSILGKEARKYLRGSMSARRAYRNMLNYSRMPDSKYLWNVLLESTFFFFFFFIFNFNTSRTSNPSGGGGGGE